MKTPRKRFAGSRSSRQMLFPAMVFLIIAVASAAMGEVARSLPADDAAAAVDAVVTVEGAAGSGA